MDKRFWPSVVRSLLPEPPEDVTEEMAVFYRSMVIGSLLVFFAHIIVTILWWWIDIPEMVWYHAFGLPLLTLPIFLSRRGKFSPALAITTAEFLIHASLGTYYAGWESGMHFPLLALSVGWAAYPGGGNSRYRKVGFLVLSVHLALLLLTQGWTPVYTLETATTKLLSFVMAMSLSIPILMLNVLQKVSAGWYQSLQIAHDKSEHLLLNVLPQPIADRLREHEEIIADRFDSASVLFLDIVDFTRISSKMTAPEIVSMLNEVFCIFDTLTDDHGMEKIKTIGDAYLAVAGIPAPQPDHARRTAHLAIDMLSALDRFEAETGRRIEARIGICSGPVVAGVIGKRKFIYDLWGDTVNTASRMESHGIPNRIQVTESTYLVLRDDYRFDERGMVDIKGKGPMKTYFLLPPPSVQNPETGEATVKNCKFLSDEVVSN